jgi:hypothetical protein
MDHIPQAHAEGGDEDETQASSFLHQRSVEVHLLSVKPTGEQQQATRGAGRLPGLLVAPSPSANGPGSGIRPGIWVARHVT